LRGNEGTTQVGCDTCGRDRFGKDYTALCDCRREEIVGLVSEMFVFLRTQVAQKYVGGIEGMLLCNFDHLIVSEQWRACRPERGIRLRHDSLRFQVLNKFVLGIVNVKL
jgi:hypothetical protein